MPEKIHFVSLRFRETREKEEALRLFAVYIHRPLSTCIPLKLQNRFKTQSLITIIVTLVKQIIKEDEKEKRKKERKKERKKP